MLWTYVSNNYWSSHLGCPAGKNSKNLTHYLLKAVLSPMLPVSVLVSLPTQQSKLGAIFNVSFSLIFTQNCQNLVQTLLVSWLYPFSTRVSLHAHPRPFYCKHQGLCPSNFSSCWHSLSPLIGQARSAKEVKIPGSSPQPMTGGSWWVYFVEKNSEVLSILSPRGCQSPWVLIALGGNLLINASEIIFMPFPPPTDALLDCLSNKLIAPECLSVCFYLSNKTVTN